MPSRSGIAATVIQSTDASRPIRAAASWLRRVEKLLLIRPSLAAAVQFERAVFIQREAAPLSGRPLLRVVATLCLFGLAIQLRSLAAPKTTGLHDAILDSSPQHKSADEPHP